MQHAYYCEFSPHTNYRYTSLFLLLTRIIIYKINSKSIRSYYILLHILCLFYVIYNYSIILMYIF